jgi:hypothetical protein
LMLCILVGIGTTCWEPLGRCAALHRIWFVFFRWQVLYSASYSASGLRSHVRREQGMHAAMGSAASAWQPCAQQRSSDLPCASFASSWRWTYDLSTSDPPEACSTPRSDACSTAMSDLASGAP